MSTFVATPAPAGLRGRIRVPGDKSISHRALLLAARAEGRSRISGLSAGADVWHTLEAMRAFGAAITAEGEGVLVDGGPDRLREPDAAIDVGNSGTAIRLLAGWATALDGLTVLAGDASIARRPMDRIAEPLRAMGARIDGRQGGRLPPLVVRGGDLHGIDYQPPGAERPGERGRAAGRPGRRGADDGPGNGADPAAQRRAATAVRGRRRGRRPGGDRASFAPAGRSTWPSRAIHLRPPSGWWPPASPREAS